MHIFISYSHLDSDFAFKLSSLIKEDGYSVFIDQEILPGNNVYKEIGKEIAKADAIIVIISENSNKSFYVANEMQAILSHYKSREAPLILPVVLGTSTELPVDLNGFIYVRVPYMSEINNRSLQGYDSKVYNKTLNFPNEKEAIEKIRFILSVHAGQIKQEIQEKKESEIKVKEGLSKYIKDVFVTLKQSEKRNRAFALWLYLISVLSMISVIAVLVFAVNKQLQGSTIEHLIFVSVVSLLICIMLISLSKLFFTLAKAFMVEAIRCSDRIHAISFGRFFLDAYGAEASREEVLQAFNSWNIDNGGSSFRNQSGEDYDPKIIEIIKSLK